MLIIRVKCAEPKLNVKRNKLNKVLWPDNFTLNQSGLAYSAIAFTYLLSRSALNVSAESKVNSSGDVRKDEALPSTWILPAL